MLIPSCPGPSARNRAGIVAAKKFSDLHAVSRFAVFVQSIKRQIASSGSGRDRSNADCLRAVPSQAEDFHAPRATDVHELHELRTSLSPPRPPLLALPETLCPRLSRLDLTARRTHPWRLTEAGTASCLRCREELHAAQRGSRPRPAGGIHQPDPQVVGPRVRPLPHPKPPASRTTRAQYLRTVLAYCLRYNQSA